MCGIFGFFLHTEAGDESAFTKRSLTTLARLSEVRGKDSSGLVFRDEVAKELRVYKGEVPISHLLERHEVRNEIDLGSIKGSTVGVMGHSRLVTNGSQLDDANNQPVVKDGVIGVHNGIIVNDRELWRRHPDIQRSYEIDTEVMLSLIRKYLRKGMDIGAAVSQTLEEVVGTVAAAFLIDDLDVVALATNNGSLYILTDGEGLLAFASEEYFLRRLAKTARLNAEDGLCIKQVVSGRGLLLALPGFRLQEFAIGRKASRPRLPFNRGDQYRILIRSVSHGKDQRELIQDPRKIAAHPKASSEAALLEFNVGRIQALRRCRKCILPETFPYIQYDEAGICNFCRNYMRKNQPQPIEELVALVKPYRRSDGRPDCIVPFSGGRDSTYTLHVVKTILHLNPIAFTYDWGMVTDLARRNIARVCGKLAVENIIVSADIRWKRDNIRKNILAWLKTPDLGMIPLFMAGDKYFYYYTDKVKHQTGIRLNIWGINPLENTDFKVGFLGVPPDHHKKRIYALSAKRQARLFLSVARNILTNPGYLNGSVWDTLGSFVSRSIIPHRDYYHLFDYYRWDEGEVEKLVREEYNWELAVDTRTTWRIGDGTAAFYNYIYYNVAGFSEHDTFRSNQIREGVLNREHAMQLVLDDNRPRYPSIKWYTDILNLDYTATIRRINAIPKLYL